ncbi:hypothetical protein GCM10011416_10490 [Polaribacter pacificus]|uniref:Uncharacterized protein n=1 Tax=Polaribacter pacificus TaxID=1775173 RepID=A0A917HX17_9FLAO|nr:hypothetical protein [Polaribacter pacificus]GGG94952.1 hypothetical protein GCM10011416_10490 [Polaribacter pacificus]
MNSYLITTALSISLLFGFNTSTDDKLKKEALKDSTLNTQKERLFTQLNDTISKDSIKEKVAYKVISRNPTLKFTIRKIGEQKRVMLSIKNGSKNIPKMSVIRSSGNSLVMGKKKGYDNVQFPFSISMNAPGNYEVNPFSNTASLLNNFEIEIYEPGYWEISFNR